MKKNKKNENNNWKDVAQSFLGNFFSQVGENISQKIKNWINEVKHKTVGAILMFVGFIFSLLSFVFCINAIFNNQIPWLGYGIVGLSVLVIGYLISEKA